MLHTLIIQVDNKPGVLNRVASLFRRRAFNIESLTVGHTEDASVSRMTVVVDTDTYGARRLEENLYKLVNVIRVDNVTNQALVSRDLAIIKVKAPAEERMHVLQLANVFRARVVDVSSESVVLEITGTEEKIDRLVELLRPVGILEMARTGRVAMLRGPASANDQLPSLLAGVMSQEEETPYSA